MAKPIEVSRRCAVTPSGTPMIAKATHANGNEKRLLISVRLALRSQVFSLLSCSSNCSIDSAERLGRFFSFSYSSSRLIVSVPSTMLIPSRILCGEIKNGAAQSLLRGGRKLHIETKTNRRARKRDASKRNRYARDADPVGAQRNQFVVRGQPSENEKDRGQQPPRNGEDK